MSLQVENQNQKKVFVVDCHEKRRDKKSLIFQATLFQVKSKVPVKRGFKPKNVYINIFQFSHVMLFNSLLKNSVPAECKNILHYFLYSFRLYLCTGLSLFNRFCIAVSDLFLFCQWQPLPKPKNSAEKVEPIDMIYLCFFLYLLLILGKPPIYRGPKKYMLFFLVLIFLFLVLKISNNSPVVSVAGTRYSTACFILFTFHGFKTTISPEKVWPGKSKILYPAFFRGNQQQTPFSGFDFQPGDS